MSEALVATPQPRLRLLDVSSHLRDFAITTFRVDPAKLAALLPGGIVPDLVPDADHPERPARAYVSSVTFTNTRFYVGWAPFVKLRCEQTNYRAYVLRGGERCVFFFGTHLASPFVHLPRIAWRMPWARSHVSQLAAWDDTDRCERYGWQGRGGHGEELLVARGTGERIGRLPGFESEDLTRLVLTHPMTGFFLRRDRRLATYAVWHAPLELERCEVEEARFELWERLGLVEPGQAPHSVLVQRLTHYLVHLPPRLVGP